MNFKNKYVLLLIIICTSLLCCESTTKVKSKQNHKIVPDQTPIIMGLVEATDDTVHHFSEVVVGLVRDVQSYEHPDILDSLDGVYNPTLMTQVYKTSQLFDLGYTPITDANVKVEGPLEQSGNQKVLLKHTKNGVYGDVNYQLPLVPEGKYKLTVQLPDGRTYQSITIIPERTDVNIPDEVEIPVHYEPYGDGTPGEEHTRRYQFVFRYPEQEFLTEVQFNTNHDRELLLLNPQESFRYKDRSPYLRTGSVYGIGMLATQTDTMYRSWSQRLDKKKEDIWMKMETWYRFSFYNKGIGEMFHPLTEIYTSGGEAWDRLDNRFLEAYQTQDTTYLFDVSTLRKLGSNGNGLPKDSLDAIGFFGGYFSVYQKTTFYPIRNFDLDSVLTAHGYE